MKKIAIIGGGPSGLFMFKRLIESGQAQSFEIDIYEKTQGLGYGMPYGPGGANLEHVTNVSDNEIPTIVNSVKDWVQDIGGDELKTYSIDADNFNEYKVLPRLLFGKYLHAQFELLLAKAKDAGIAHNVYLKTKVEDVINKPTDKQVAITLQDGVHRNYDAVVICTGHHWPKKHEGTYPKYFDSPYPPIKLQFTATYPVAVRGASLTAIDAIRTLARANGTFAKDANGKLRYSVADTSAGFKIVMHTKNGLMPAMRFHLEDSHLSKKSLLSNEELAKHINENNGFLSLDYIFEEDFKAVLKEKDPKMYAEVAHMGMEEFIDHMMQPRRQTPPFELFMAEYNEAAESIRERESVHWKELLAILSFAMNYPAKYFSAEDMQRLQKHLMPLISIVIAFVPQNSAEELLALYGAGALQIVAVGDDSEVVPQPTGGIAYTYTDGNDQPISNSYQAFVDCIGQPHLSIDKFPFASLVKDGVVSQATVKFKQNSKAEDAIAAGAQGIIRDSDENAYYLPVSGLGVNDAFQVMEQYQRPNPRIYLMAVPFMGGYNPDYSGLDFSEEASMRIIKAIESV